MASKEQFKTSIGGQALIEGIMMRGPEKDAVVIKGPEGMVVELKDRKKIPEKSPLKWPLVRGVYGFFDSQIVGVKALMRSAEVAEESIEEESEPSKFDKWLEEKLGNEAFQKLIVGVAVCMGVGLSVLLFFLLPMIIGSFFYRWLESQLTINLIEGLVRMVIFVSYMFLVSRMQEMKRVFSYHGAEHKTIRCYEAGLPLTVENVRVQTRLHPRCGTSFLLVVMILSILVFSVASSLLLSVVPTLAAMKGSLLYRLIMIVFKLMMLPLVVAISYEINRYVGRHDNTLTRIMTAPGMWFQNFTTNEPDDAMIEVGIQALKAVIPAQEGSDRW